MNPLQLLLFIASCIGLNPCNSTIRSSLHVILFFPLHLLPLTDVPESNKEYYHPDRGKQVWQLWVCGMDGGLPWLGEAGCWQDVGVPGCGGCGILPAHHCGGDEGVPASEVHPCTPQEGCHTLEEWWVACC